MELFQILMILNSIEFYPNFEHLPLDLDANDSYAEVVQKLGQEANFISKERDDAHYRYWFFKERGYLLWFMFEDDELEEINSVIVRTYEAPSKYDLKPYISQKEK